jgi:tRNA pseudouridine38-40 synthase
VLNVERSGEEIRISASARSFLHHQLRSITGSLKLVGEGTWTPADLRAAREAKDSTRCGAMAPSCGLYLMKGIIDARDDAVHPIILLLPHIPLEYRL